MSTSSVVDTLRLPVSEADPKPERRYSRRIAAFQGVRIDAEDPGNVPDPVERFK